MDELVAVADFLWLAGTALAGCLLLYGAFLVYEFNSAASAAIHRTIARLALHDSERGLELADGGKVLRP